MPTFDSFMRTTTPNSGSTPIIPHVNIGWIHPFLEILDEVGVDVEAILKRAHLPTLSIDNGSVLVPTGKIYQFVTLAAQSANLDDLGFKAGQRVDIESLLPSAERTWTRSGSFRSVRSFIEVALDSSSNVDMWIESRDDPRPITEFFYLGTFGPSHPAFTTVEQFMMALMVRWVRYGAGSSWNPDRINLRATSVPEAAVRELVGEASVRYGQAKTSIEFPSQQFLGPIWEVPRRGSALWQRHQRRLDAPRRAPDLAGSLRVVLPAYLPDGSPDIRKAATLAGTSVRTLQRRLSVQGVTYSELLEGLRHDLAIYLLRRSNQSASAISRELGYRDPAIFTRAFRRWTGQTPSQYRTAAGAEPVPGLQDAS